jgi:purine-cytosine permease-like protein
MMSDEEFNQLGRPRRVKMAGYAMPVPASRIARIGLGVLLVLGGVLSFLPVLGLWMLPLGLIVLSVDFALVRRWRRRGELWWARRRAERPNRRNG